jgi:hypothetical protein
VKSGEQDLCVRAVSCVSVSTVIGRLGGHVEDFSICADGNNT